jgi:TM2 domain-containing membrane protein YozV
MTVSKSPSNLIVAYLLWGLGFFGICGMHRFYLNKPVSAVIWFFSFGGFFIGQYLVDPFLIPGMVKERNRELRDIVKEDLYLQNDHPMRQLLKAAKQNDNVLSLSQAIISTNLAPEETRNLLIEALRLDLAYVDNDPVTGAVRYYFDI